MRYHERTKHHFARFAPGPGQLDWANQPDPFRRFEGAPLTRLPLLAPDDEPRPPPYDSLYAPGAVASAPRELRALSRLFEYALSLSAWKQAGGTRWALRGSARPDAKAGQAPEAAVEGDEEREDLRDGLLPLFQVEVRERDLGHGMQLCIIRQLHLSSYPSRLSVG